ncbi:RING-H2 finger protein ATL2 [Diospyros lotus]|uniref:RING-H2 finger protein ATL2 n=1 Tax=Diospyros lotus TaxID=55363 RepID=UPI0022563E8C|nr:RING-H2 finger protein ATL2 [Diospyros lotus]
MGRPKGPVTNSSPDNGNFALSGRIMLSAIVILFAVVVLMICLHIYARWYLLRTRQRQRLRRRSRRRTHLIFYVEPNAPAASRGLDGSVLSSLPVFVYSAAAQPDALECAVCLCEFEENEKARLLPKCKHSFHTECIDMWFHSHSTCPLCRSSVEAVPECGSNVVVSVGEPDGAEAASSSSPCAACRQQEDASSSSLADRRKAFEPANVRIDVPSRSELVDELGLSSPASHGTKSPSSRLLSLRRILSMNRKGPAVSPSSELGTSCGVGTAELETECGGHESSRHQTPR